MTWPRELAGVPIEVTLFDDGRPLRFRLEMRVDGNLRVVAAPNLADGLKVLASAPGDAVV